MFTVHRASHLPSPAILATTALLALAACSPTPPPASEGIGFRQTRHAEIVAVQSYRECRDEALLLDRQARSAGEAARYLTSARLLERCEEVAGNYVEALPLDERMRTLALAAQNHLRGGDVGAARQALDRFAERFPSRDLYYADGSSFIETMDLLLGPGDRGAAGQFAVANVGAIAKAELRRLAYWKRH